MDLNQLKNSEYEAYVGKKAPPSPLLKNMVKAFFFGGLICAGGQGLKELYTHCGVQDAETASLLASATLIVIAALLTGLGVFDRIAKHAGAGTLVPITGFSNAMTAPALEFKSEGFILGTGVKMFTVAGPVLTYGVAASVVYGVIRAIIEK